MMGLLSGIPGKRTAPAAAAWRPLRDTPVKLTGTDADVDDRSQIIDADFCPIAAYQVAFGMLHPAGAVITVTTYVTGVAAQSPGESSTYHPSLHFRCTSEAHPGWSFTGYAGDPLEGVYDLWADADAEAGAWAEVLATGDPGAMGNLPGVFGWDGYPSGAGEGQ
jgi:hypothetical protein